MTKVDVDGDLIARAPLPAQNDVADTRRLLLELLQQLEQNGELRLPTAEARITFAKRIYRTRRLRAEFFGDALFRDPAWDILLLLYCAEGSDDRMSVSAVCAACGASHTTGIRWVQLLEEAGFVAREPNASDRRVTWLSLTPKARDLLDAFFDQIVKNVFQSLS